MKRRYIWIAVLITLLVHLSQSYRAAQYTELLNTYSDHRLLESDQREALFEEIREMIRLHGGSIRVGYEAHLHLGRRTA